MSDDISVTPDNLLWAQRLEESADFISHTYNTTFQLSQSGLLYQKSRERVVIVTEDGIFDVDYSDILKRRLKHDNIAIRHVGAIWIDGCVGLISQNEIHVAAPPFSQFDLRIPITNPVPFRFIDNGTAIPREPASLGTRYTSGPLSVGFGAYGAEEFASLVIAPDRRSATWRGLDENGFPPQSLGLRVGGVGPKVITSFSLNADPIRYADMWARVVHVGNALSGPEALEHPKHQRLHCFMTDDLILTFSRGFFEGKRPRPLPIILDLRTRREIKPKLPKPHQDHQIIGIAPGRLFLSGQTDHGANEVVCYRLDTSAWIAEDSGSRNELV